MWLLTPARVTLLIRFSSRIFCVLLVPWHSQGLASYISSGWAESQGGWEWVGMGGSLPFLPCRECGRLAYRSINIKSSRKYNLLTHCSPSGVRGLAGTRRVRYIHMQTPRYAHKPTEVFQDHRPFLFSKLVWDSWWVGSTSWPLANGSFVYILLTRGNDQWPQKTM